MIVLENVCKIYDGDCYAVRDVSLKPALASGHDKVRWPPPTEEPRSGLAVLSS